MRTNTTPGGKKHTRRSRLVQISVSGLPPEVMKRIQARAKRERRSKSFVIVDILTAAVEAQESATHPSEKSAA